MQDCSDSFVVPPIEQRVRSIAAECSSIVHLPLARLIAAYAVEYDATSEWIRQHLLPPCPDLFNAEAVQQACQRAATQLFQTWSDPSNHSTDHVAGLIFDLQTVAPCKLLPAWLEQYTDSLYEDVLGNIKTSELLLTALTLDGLEGDRLLHIRKTLLQSEDEDEEDEEDEEEEEEEKKEDSNERMYNGASPVIDSKAYEPLSGASSEENKQRFLQFMRLALSEIQQAIGGSKKEAAARKMFDFLVQHQVLSCAGFQSAFRDTVRNKLIALDSRHNLDWVPLTFQQLFGQPLPRLQNK